MAENRGIICEEDSRRRNEDEARRNAEAARKRDAEMAAGLEAERRKIIQEYLREISVLIGA